MRIVTLDIPAALVQDARLFSARSHDLDAVCHVLQDYGRLVRQIRQLRQRVAEFDTESADFDSRLEAIQRACRAMLEL